MSARFPLRGKKNEPIIVAAVRVIKDAAEIPLLATLSNYRRSEMCRECLWMSWRSKCLKWEFVDWSFRLWQRL
ncbi:hypothetical protein Bca52824_009765 [Brassica carinata]|uniref:Uncharacterized protein n=1 Tax=Brassica carinata TaxID=52824 RepID=A0A8X8BA28_BRACI|nr:hypothetical protein Bca52824_009765 [Brassica carinata]